MTKLWKVSLAVVFVLLVAFFSFVAIVKNNFYKVTEEDLARYGSRDPHTGVYTLYEPVRYLEFNSSAIGTEEEKEVKKEIQQMVWGIKEEVENKPHEK